MNGIKNHFLTLAVFVVGIAAWQLVTSYNIIPNFLLPSPTQIANEYFISNVNWPEQTSVTLYEILAGFGLGAVGAILLSLAMTQIDILRRIIMPYLVITQVIPLVAVAPILYIIIGFNDESRIILTSLLSFFPIVVNASTGMVDVDKNHLYMLKVLGAGGFETFTKVRLPNSLPYLFNGFKIGITGAVIGAVIAEFISSSRGLGFIMITSFGVFNIAQLFAALVIVVLLGLALFGLLDVVAKVAMPWFSRR